jgi:hypothetical protein
MRCSCSPTVLPTQAAIFRTDGPANEVDVTQDNSHDDPIVTAAEIVTVRVPMATEQLPY